MGSGRVRPYPQASPEAKRGDYSSVDHRDCNKIRLNTLPTLHRIRVGQRRHRLDVKCHLLEPDIVADPRRLVIW